MTVLSPGSTIGILGSGQLGRMLAMAAARLGFRCHIYADAPGPAFDVAAATTVGSYDDRLKLAAFAACAGVATYEFENIPVETVAFLSQLIPVRPGVAALACAQDRLNEKQLARELGAMTADFAAANSFEELVAAIEVIGAPGILKTRRFGYDGKGQVKINAPSDAKAAWDAIRGQPAILEKLVPFNSEVSVVAVRAADGSFAAYDVTANEHRHHILHTSAVPAAMSEEAMSAAIATTKGIADALNYTGVLAVEFFALSYNRRDVLYVNEIAPRVHNSGHWTIDACAVSQFENHIRAVAGWPVGPTSRHSNAVMTNLIGKDANAWGKLAAEPATCVHLYGKHEARAGRKMGHVTRISPKIP